MPNRLAEESSPYLLQHANNPVDWSPWNAAALERSKTENRPIFLSIGYSACHWCHVMEHESFENPVIARILNEHFVCIKVDREERPDLDQIYMNAVQIMTGRGGWPMSVFLTPDLKPFYGGTYWPPTARSGMPGFDQVLLAVADAWLNRRGQAIEQAEQLTEHLQELAPSNVGSGVPTPRLIMGAAAALEKNFDTVDGGFGDVPKFPHPMDLRLLLRVWRRTGRANLLHVVTFTLSKMAAGGMYDQLAGGFHRYSTDARWLVPHFEKMLYDNALLTAAYLEAYQATGATEFARVARETCDYVLREMTDAAGGFYSTQDADSEGVEGKFFVWTPEEIATALGDAAAATFCRVYDVTPGGNFEEQNILHLPRSIDDWARELGREPTQLRAELDESRAKLLAARERRVHPGLDDKVLAAWNGLMIDSLAQAASALDEPRYLAAAVKAAEFVVTQMSRHDGRLLHSWRGGVAKLDAYLDDYACLINSLVTLYEATFDERWIGEASRLADLMLALFADRENGGFYYTASDHEQLITRQKDLFDNATPSGNSMAALGLLRLANLTGRADLLAAVEGTFAAAANLMLQSPTAAGQMLIAYDMHLGPAPEIVILGDPNSQPTAKALADLRRRFLPNKVVALRAVAPTSGDSSLLAAMFAGKAAHGPEPTVFICEHFTCQSPVFGPDAATSAWERLEAERTSI